MMWLNIVYLLDQVEKRCIVDKSGRATRHAGVCLSNPSVPCHLQTPPFVSRCAPPERRCLPRSGEPGVQPALTSMKARWMVHVKGTAARAKRVAPARKTTARFRAPLLAAPQSCAVQGLFFGDFLLARRRKSPRRRAGLPAMQRVATAPRQSNPTQHGSRISMNDETLCLQCKDAGVRINHPQPTELSNTAHINPLD